MLVSLQILRTVFTQSASMLKDISWKVLSAPVKTLSCVLNIIRIHTIYSLKKSHSASNFNLLPESLHPPLKPPSLNKKSYL